MLLEKGANPNTKDSDENSPLLIACGTGGARSVKILLTFGADIESTNKYKDTALHACFYRGNNDCFEELIKFSKAFLLFIFLDPKTSTKNGVGIIPMEGLFMHNQSDILE